MTETLLFQAAFLAGTWVVTGWVTLLVIKVRLEYWMDRTTKLEEWKEKTETRINAHEVRIALLEK